MRKFLIHLLILLMLMPGLACGPFMNAGKAQAAQSMQGMKDCPGMMGMKGAQSAPVHENQLRLFKDCLKVDLSSADHVVLQTPDLNGKVFSVAWANTVPAYSFTPERFQAIRGPPPDWPSPSETQPSILLTTQRLRI